MSHTTDRRSPAGGPKAPTHVFRGGGSPRKEVPPASSSSSTTPPRAQPDSPPTSNGTTTTTAPGHRGCTTTAAAPSTRSLAASPLSPSCSCSCSCTSEAPSNKDKDKDARIASLERELSATEAQFSRDLDRLSRSESETASFWQARHSALNQQFLRTDTELRLLREDVARARARESETAEDDDDDAPPSGYRDALEAELREKDDEVRGLRAQVRGLKEWVSARTRADGTASDEVFAAGMANLGNGLQNWVITNFRRARMVVADLSLAGGAALQEEEEHLAGLVPACGGALARAAKVHLLQSVVSRILVRRIFCSYFVGLSPEQELQLRRTEELLGSFGSVESVNHWRSVTLSILKRDAARNMQVHTTQTAEDVVTRINRALDSITTDTAGHSGNSNTTVPTNTDARDQTLRQLVYSAIELSRLLVVQKAVFEVWMPEILPNQQVIFDHATMEDVGGEDEENLVQREICCVTFPGITKRGDENGGQLQFRNVISRARVLCSAE